ncbi:hypothetical protein F1559_003338 [Cyanidiococcus yangmingshanensis]|uniref:Uncharacterized protein n=1 Tax=Cyanidiococcus yangmingshanensis TaxID=2690220 RepID=A0A7J7IEN3_9RHOD|nr:hypothetical protein F1559_003338 [Cyanidiococcus yangmingshanensis]
MEESTLDELQLIQRDHLVEMERLRVLCFQESLGEDGARTDNSSANASGWFAGFQAGIRLGELAGKAYAYRSWVLATSPARHEESSSERASPGRGTGPAVPAFTVESTEELEMRVGSSSTPGS